MFSPPSTVGATVTSRSGNGREAWKDGRAGSPSGAWEQTSWSPTRTLELLDLTGTWPVRNSAAHALISALRPVCQAWARAIAAQFPALDGLWVDSTITGDPNVVLWSSAANAMPTTPNWSRALADPAFRPVVAAIARTDLGYAVI